MAQNIKVAVRARPLNQREIDMDCGVVVSMQDKTVTVQVNKQPKHFTYDYAYCSIDSSDPSSATQKDVYNEVGTTILNNAIDGFNGTLFAYGQTGSGKSHSMMGPPDDYGVIPLMIIDLFEKKKSIEAVPDKELQVWVSYLEIYKERITDLFSVDKEQKEVKIMEHPKLGVYTQGLVELPCETKEAVMTNLEYGLQRRSIGATAMNQTSSRSHAVFCIKTTALDGPKPQKKGSEDERKALSAKISLVDLAGSERASKTGAEGERLKEGSAINQSLSSLGMVIKNITEKKGQVPFRSSKLTFLLKDSLAGNARTYMMAAISPASDNVDETVSTLRFASSVKTIETVAVQNKDKKDQLIDDLQEEMKALKAQLAFGDVNTTEAKAELRERERLIKEELQKDFQEQLGAAKDLQAAREQALKENGLSQQHITTAFGIGSMTPYLVNMAFDPMLAGKLIYLINENLPTSIGAHQENSIILDGIGIPDFLCRITNDPGTGVMIKRLCGTGRIGVNGKPLRENEEVHLHNGDQLYLGRSTALKLVFPADGGQAELNKNELLLADEHDMFAMLEHSPSWKSLEMFVDSILRPMPPTSASAFLQHIKRACQFTDEANELTPEYRAELSMHFEVDVTSSMPPCIVIRVLTCPHGRECTDEGEWQTKYVWSLSQLEERLDRMRDYAQAVKLDAAVSLDPLEDPWLEAEPVEIAQRLRDLQQKAVEADRAMLQQLSMRENNASNERSIVSIVFWFWRSQVATEKKKSGPSKVGRPALVRSKTLNKMRMTIVPNKKAPESTGKRGDRSSVASNAPGDERSPPRRSRSGLPPDAEAEAPRPSQGGAGARAAATARAPAETKAPAVSFAPAVEEAPEATPETTASASERGVERGGVPADREAMAALQREVQEAKRSSRALEEENEALRRQLSEAESKHRDWRAQAEREAQALRAELSGAKGLQQELGDSQAENANLEKQLEVAWQLSSVLRDQLLSIAPKMAEAGTPSEMQPSDVVPMADALTATARSVTAAAQAVNDIQHAAQAVNDIHQVVNDVHAKLIGRSSPSVPSSVPSSPHVLQPPGLMPWAPGFRPPARRTRSTSPFGRTGARPAPPRAASPVRMLVAPTPPTPSPPVSWPPSFVAAPPAAPPSSAPSAVRVVRLPGWPFAGTPGG